MIGIASRRAKRRGMYSASPDIRELPAMLLTVTSTRESVTGIGYLKTGKIRS